MSVVENGRSSLKRRTGLLMAVLGLWSVVVEARLVQLQVIRHDEFARQAENQQNDQIEITAPRGDIVDREGRLLATSVDALAMLAYPKRIGTPAQAVATLCGALGDCTAAERADWTTRFSGKRPFYLRRARAVSPPQAARVKDLKLPFVQLTPETARFYPNSELGAHVLGFVNDDNKGLGGVEYAFDDVVRGQGGMMLVQVDGRSNREINRMLTRVEKPATAGATLELTLDLQIQHVVESELLAGIKEHGAESGTAIVMDPQTGEILGMASYPTFNPNSFGLASVAARRNRAVTDTYEPGSTFKIVTAAAAIEEGVMRPTDLVDTSPGRMNIGSRVIKDSSGHNYGVISFEDVIVKSSNVGAVKTGLRVGAERLARYERRFGFGEILSPHFRGQSAGKVWSPSAMDDSALASVSMGYQVSVTPLQMAIAASAIANGGLLVEPHILRATTRNGQREAIAPKPLRRAIEAETAATLTMIMEDVVVRGTATAAQLDRFEVAGKTGTASKIIDGRYSKTHYYSSFVGFAPARQPAFTILVVLDSPLRGSYYGGVTAAPIFKRIAEGVARITGLAPTINPDPAVVITPVSQTPVPQLTRTTVIPTVTELGGRALMPDVRGLGMREALRVLGRAGLFVRPSGEGFVVAQSPDPGTPIDPGGWSVLEFRRQSGGVADVKGGGR